MTIPLRQSTASQEIPLGYFLDATDGDTEETGLTIANTDIKLWKNGATTLANKNSGGATHISNGIYYCVLDTTDSNTCGPLKVFVHVSGARSVTVECTVYPANVYDSLVKGTDMLYADMMQIRSNTGAATALEDFADNCYDEVNNKVQSDIIYIHGTALTETSGQLAAGFSKLFDVATPLLVASEAMRGTDHTSLNDISVADIIAGVADGSLDLQEMMRLILAACVCKSSGGGTLTGVFRDSADSKNRITATVDTSGNRTNVVLDGS